MVYVSVNAYDDGRLLEGCLASIREHLPEATIGVVDGRYETWPNGEDNSTDETPEIAASHGAQYHPDGPYPREEHKHRHRIELAPEGERCLFIDADERLVTATGEGFDDGTAYRVRILNAKVYGGQITFHEGEAYTGQITYYPRLFYPSQMAEIPRVDRYTLDAPVDRTDAITIAHRADLRSNDYRDAKIERFDAEDRGPWYEQHLEMLNNGEVEFAFGECPECGRESLSRSRVTGYGTDDAQFSRVAVCTADDGCHRSIEPYDVGEWRYLPDDVERGFAEDLERVRIELMDAGWQLAKVVPDHAFRRYGPNARIWVRDNLNTGERPVSADD